MKKRARNKGFDWKPLSTKQQKLLMWWLPESPHHEKDMVIAEGAIRSGKTVAMIDSFLTWSLDTFEGETFIIAGKTAGALKRNVIVPLLQILTEKKLAYNYNRSEHYIEIGSNTYYCFGAATEASQDVLQGLTAAGAYADEVALMPKSFVDQMIGRCSIDGSRIFLNCNPAGPYHWFKTEFIDKAKEKRAYVLHFDMDDNLTLSERVKERFRRMFSGVFYKRYILGLWVMAEGVIFDMFDEEQHVVPNIDRDYTQYKVSVDFGTLNPTAFGLWGKYGKTWYKIKEYHHDGRKSGKQKTVSQYSRDLREFVGHLDPDIIVDPSATALKVQLEEDGFYVIDADNAVSDGIANMGMALMEGLIKYNEGCRETFREFHSYVWDEKAAKERGEDKPVKQNDHHMDADRYFVQTVLFAEGAFFTSESAW